jgi:hypothetical protein
LRPLHLQILEGQLKPEVCSNQFTSSPGGHLGCQHRSAELPLDRKRSRASGRVFNLIRARSRNATVFWRVCAPPERPSSQNDRLGCLILLGITPRYILAGTLRFRHDLLVSTHVSNTTLSALKGVSCSSTRLQWLDGTTLLVLQVSQCLRLVSQLLASLLLASCFFYERPCPVRLGLLGARAEGGGGDC